MSDPKTKPLHVVLIQNQFPEETHWGGISTFGWFMSAALAREGVKVSVICQSISNVIEPVQIVKENVHVYRIPGKKPITGFINRYFSSRLSEKEQWFSFNAWRIVKQWISTGKEIDIIDAADYLGCSAFILKDAQIKIPVVITCHTPSFLADEMNEGKVGKNMNSHKKVYKLELFGITNAAALLAPSHRISNLLAAKTGRSINDFFTNPYPFPLQREIQMSPKPVAIDQPYVLFSGRIERRKGVQRLLEAWSNSEFKSTYNLVLAGKKTNHFQEFERFAVGMTGTKVHFIGHRDRSELSWLYRNASLVVLPSEPFDNYPYTCVESLGLGAPTLVSDSGGMSEMIVDDENGWIFRTGSTEDLRDRIDEILNLTISERMNRGLKAQQSVRRINDPVRIASRTIKFYRRLIEDFN